MIRRLSVLNAFWYGRIVFFTVLLIAGTGMVSILSLQQDVTFFVMLAGISIGTEVSRTGGTWFTLGLHPRFMGRQIAWAVVFAVCSLGVIGVVALALGAKVETHGSVLSILPVATTFFYLTIHAASEELAFRGVVFQAIYERFGGLVAILCTSILFSIAHIFNPFWSAIGFVNILLAGVLFSTMYSVTRSLWLPIVFHTSWNIIQYFLLGSPVSGLYFGLPLIEIRNPAPTSLYTVLIGGSFGIEGGIMATIVLLISIGVCTLPAIAQIPPELAAQLFRRQYMESAVRHTCGNPFRVRSGVIQGEKHL